MTVSLLRRGATTEQSGGEREGNTAPAPAGDHPREGRHVARQRASSLTEPEDPVTIRDIYILVQQLNARTVELVQQVNTLTSRAQEDRSRAELLAADIQKLKIKVYSAGAAIILLGSVLMIVEKVSAVSGHG